MIGTMISHYPPLVDKILEKLGEGGPNYARAWLGGLVPRSPEYQNPGKSL